MKFNLLMASAALGACLTFAGAASAAELVHGAYYGTGNNYSPGNWTTNTVLGDELGVRAHVYQQAALAPVGNVYNIALGQIASFDWSFDPTADGSLDPAAALITISITNLGTGGNATYNPFVFTPDNVSGTPFGAIGGFQNSARLSFGIFNGAAINAGNINYNAGVDSTYDVVVSATNAQGIFSTTARIVQGAGAAVPEPSSWALMILGFGGLGTALRSQRRKTLALAAA